MIGKVDIATHAAAASLHVPDDIGELGGHGQEVRGDLVGQGGAISVNHANFTGVRMVIEDLGEAPVLLKDCLEKNEEEEEKRK